VEAHHAPRGPCPCCHRPADPAPRTLCGRCGLAVCAACLTWQRDPCDRTPDAREYRCTRCVEADAREEC